MPAGAVILTLTKSDVFEKKKRKALFQWMEESIDFLSMVRFLLEILVGKLILFFCNAKNPIFIEIGWEIIFLKNFILGMKLQLIRGNCIKIYLLNLLSLEHFNLFPSYFWNSSPCEVCSPSSFFLYNFHQASLGFTSTACFTFGSSDPMAAYYNICE